MIRVIKLLIKKFILVTILALFSCNKLAERNIDDQRLEFNIENLISEKGNVINYTDLFTAFKIIPLESSDKSIFSKIDELKILKDTIFVFDYSTKSIYLFSTKGDYINKIKRIGKGPGEYIYIFDIDIDIVGGSIFIYVLSARKILIYNSKGDFLSSISLPYYFTNLCSYSNGFYLFRNYPDRISEDQYLIYFIDNKGKVLFKTLEYNEIIHGPGTVNFFMGGNFYKTDKDVKVHSMFSNCIFSLNQNKINPFIILTSKKHFLSQKDLDNATIDYRRIDFSKILYNEKLYSIFNYSENNNLAHFKFSIGLKQYKAFYKFKTKEFICSHKLNDDLTFINPTLFRIDQSKFIAFISLEQISKFKQIVKEGKLRMDDSERERIINTSDYSNPIIIIYDLKEKL